MVGCHAEKSFQGGDDGRPVTFGTGLDNHHPAAIPLAALRVSIEYDV